MAHARVIGGRKSSFDGRWRSAKPTTCRDGAGASVQSISRSTAGSVTAVVLAVIERKKSRTLAARYAKPRTPPAGRARANPRYAKVASRKKNRKSTFLRLREPGKTEELGIKLEPRTLRADVAIGPKTARWPGEALQVSVKLFDHRGRPVTDALKHKPRVFVNVDQVEPMWTHSGNTYTAKVAQSPGSGPWVVRVEVNDDFGDEVARDFIELGGT